MTSNSSGTFNMIKHFSVNKKNKQHFPVKKCIILRIIKRDSPPTGNCFIIRVHDISLSFQNILSLSFKYSFLGENYSHFLQKTAMTGPPLHTMSTVDAEFYFQLKFSNFSEDL